jgi:hypothetical protein
VGTRRDGSTFVGFWALNEFAAVIDAMASKRGMDRSTFLRSLVRDEAVRTAALPDDAEDAADE